MTHNAKKKKKKNKAKNEQICDTSLKNLTYRAEIEIRVFSY